MAYNEHSHDNEDSEVQMPTYEYKCEACNHTFEQWQSFSEDVLTKCPQCKKKKLTRLFGSGAAILFKGSGFYETDYNRGESYQKAKSAEDSASAPAATPAPDAPATTAPATEKKPATKKAK